MNIELNSISIELICSETPEFQLDVIPVVNIR